MSVEGNAVLNKQEITNFEDEDAKYLEHQIRPFSYLNKYGKTQQKLVEELIAMGFTRDEIEERLGMPRPSLRRCIHTLRKRN